jgi:hypothetical protein
MRIVRALRTRCCGFGESRGTREMLRRIAIIFLAVAVVSLTTAAQCGGPQPPDGGPPKTADVSVQHRFPSQGAPRCTGTLGFHFQPLQLTGAEGTDTQFSSPNLTVGELPSGGYCTTSWYSWGLKEGRWRISVVGSWGETCEVDLKNGSNWLSVTRGEGCKFL